MFLRSGLLKRSLRVVALCVVAFACGSCRRSLAQPLRPGQQASGDFTDQFQVGGRTRNYLVHVPTQFSGSAPLLLAFHGGGGQAAGMDRLTHLNASADRYGFIVVFPDGVDRSWADGRGNTPADLAGVDDVGFVAALLDRLAGQVSVDPSRVFATGISNGGIFSQRLGCDLADRLAGIAPDAGSLPALVAPRCQPAKPIAVLTFHGTEDPLVPYGGGHVNGRGDGGDVLSVDDTIAEWSRLDGCSGQAQTVPLPDVVNDGTHIRTQTFSGCAGNTSVKLYTIDGGGHTWPGGLQYLPERLIGRTTRQIDASDLIGRFVTGQ